MPNRCSAIAQGRSVLLESFVDELIPPCRPKSRYSTMISANLPVVKRMPILIAPSGNALE